MTVKLTCQIFFSYVYIIVVKPYIPYDVIPSDYVLPMAYNANGEMLPIRKLNVPKWVVDTDIPLLPVHFTTEVESTLQYAVSKKKLKFCKSKTEAIDLITQVLRQDIRGVQQGRGHTVAITNEKDDNQPADSKELESKDDNPNNDSSFYHCRLDCMDISFLTTTDGIEIQSISITK